MKVHIVKPYSLTKDLGQAYNEAMSRISDGDWACLMDYDAMFLEPDCGRILHDYAEKFPHAGLMTCFTNRISPSAKDQLLDGVVSENFLIDYHTERAYQQKRFLYQATELKHEISGFLMMVKKETWKLIKFRDGVGCLGVDNNFCWDLMKANGSIYRMDGLYVFHSYRIKNGIQDKSHLR